MAIVDSTIIIADDLTGANDTALQFFKKGLSTRVLIDYEKDYKNCEDFNNIDVWAVSTESRNIDKKEALRRVVEITKNLKDNLNIDNFYKKIDSTLRGNTGLEIVGVLETTGYDVAIVAPAYIEENRTTIGGYQLLNGQVLERTQCALDPKSPITESYIPDILKKDLNFQLFNLIDIIGLNTVSKGAGPIALKINELVQQGKRVIVVDAMSNTDLEQISLAIEKSSYKVLPCASAGLAGAINKTKTKNIVEKKNIELPDIPKLIISGSATQLTLKQIEKLKEDKKDAAFFDLEIKDVINENEEEIINNLAQKISSVLSSNKDAIVHSSYIGIELTQQSASNTLIDAGIAKAEFSSKITDFLANLISKISEKNDFISVIIGGETSYKCANALKSAYFDIVDDILDNVPLLKDDKGRFIVTKSGNFGLINTLVDIINYFNKANNG